MAMTRKEFWIQAYLAFIGKHGSKKAVALADEALAECEARWRTPEIRPAAQLMADVPVGEPDPSLPSKLYQRPARKRS